jgi:hypothetical protein
MTSSQKAEGSIFEVLHRQGYKIGSHSTYAWKQFQHAFSWKFFQGMVIPKGYTDYVPTRGSIELMKEKDFDVMITALGHLDKVSHKYGPGSKEYIEEAARSDDCVRMMFEALPEGWNFMVFGDHGHDLMGRHVPGLDIPAGYVYYGPAFKKGVRKNMDLTSHYAILSMLFHVPVANPPLDDNLEEIFVEGWVDRPNQYASEPEARNDGAATGIHKAGVRLPDEMLFLLVFMVLGGITFTVATRKISRKAGLLAGAACVLLVWLEGFSYVWLRTKIHQQPWVYDYCFWILEFAACVAAVYFFRRREPVVSNLFLACVLYFCLTLFTGLPTIYNFGATRFIMHGMMALTVCMAVVLWRRHAAGWKSVFRGPLLTVAAAMFLIGINIDVLVNNFQYRYFYWSNFLFRIVDPAISFAVLSAILCAVIFNMGRKGIYAFLVVQVFAFAHAFIPAWVYLVALVFSVALFLPAYMKPAFLRKINSRWNLAAALVVMTYFSNFSMERMNEWIVLILMGILVIMSISRVIEKDDAGRYRETLVLLGALVVVVLGIFSFWIMFGLRIAGLDFQPVLNWFPTGWQTQLWPLIAAMILYGYVLPFLCLASVLGEYVPASIPVLRKTWLLLGVGKIVCVAIFLRAMIISSPGQFLLRDSVEDIIIWIVMSIMAAVYLFGGTRGKGSGESLRAADAAGMSTASFPPERA